MSLLEIKNKLQELGNSQKAEFLQRFFKTGPGEYGEGDLFLGIRVPELRKIAKENLNISLMEVEKLLKSSIHEERLLSILMLVLKYTKGTEPEKKFIYGLYLKNTRFINSWDLVDCSAGHIIGAFLFNKSRKPLYRLAESSFLWKRRISIISTFHFIKHNEFYDTFRLSEILLSDKEDLIHKAVGWMLREVGKRDPASEEKFLKEYYKKMPRTMLRYSIEKFPEAKRQKFLKGSI
jgi:3-methyladenine DNA glycosylase AlkD